MSTQTSNPKHYTIREAANLSGLPESTLRYYESIGLIRPIDRDSSSKHRSYSQDDLNLIDAIACLNATGLSLQGMRAYIENLNHGIKTASEQMNLLQAQKQRLNDEAKFLKIRQEYVDLKIAYWKAVEAGDTVQVEAIATKARKLAGTLKRREQ